MITFDTHPDRYKHWKLTFDGPIATLSMDVREDAGLSPDYKLKLNSYDLGVDIELADAIQRLRFEHPEVRTVIVSSLKERIFCAGANIMMLRGSSHVAKVNFCKFTNDAPGDRGRERELRAEIPGGAQRHLRRRRFELASRRRHPAGRRRQLGGQPAGGAAARRAPGTGGLTRRRQTARPPRSRRFLQHAGRRREGRCGRVETGRRHLPDEPVQGGGAAARASWRRPDRPKHAAGSLNPLNPTVASLPEIFGGDDDDQPRQAHGGPDDFEADRPAAVGA
jgi:hypothetical protein